MTGCRRYGADTPARQAHVAAPVTTRSAKSPKRSQNRSSMVAAVEARESALKLQASRLQRHMDPETLAKLVKAEGSDYQKRYNAAARRWISTIVALPVFIVLSYHLYNRREFWGPHLQKSSCVRKMITKASWAVVLGHEPKTVPRQSENSSSEWDCEHWELHEAMSKSDGEYPSLIYNNTTLHFCSNGTVRHQRMVFTKESCRNIDGQYRQDRQKEIGGMNVAA